MSSNPLTLAAVVSNTNPAHKPGPEPLTGQHVTLEHLAPPKSRKAAEKLGFVYKATFRQDQINKGRNRDSAWFSIIDSEWLLCRKAFEKWLEDGNFDEQQ
jgi:hypothetical protein